MNKSILLVFILKLLFLLSCDVDSISGLIDKTGTKFADKDTKIKYLDSNQEEQKDFTKDFREIEYEDLVAPIEPVVQPLISLNNKAEIQNIEHTLKKEIKEGDLIPYTNEEKEANKAIKDLERIIEDSGFSKLIEDASELKDRCALVNSDFYNVREKIQSEITLLREDYKNNRDKIRKLIQLQNKLKIEIELEKLINEIDTAEQDVRSAALFFDKAKETLKESITKRLKSKSILNRNRLSYIALQLSRQARSEAENALSQLESYASKKGEVISRKREIEELIQEASSVLVSFKR